MVFLETFGVFFLILLVLVVFDVVDISWSVKYKDNPPIEIVEKNTTKCEDGIITETTKC